VRLLPWLVPAALIAYFGRIAFETAPEPAAAGPQSSGRCDAPAPGPPGRSAMTTPSGLAVSVVTPSDYAADARYGLLVLYPPAGFSRAASERFYGVTARATGAGFVVAMSDALPLSRRAIAVQAEVAAEVRQRWCIDPGRIVFAGHSDGGALAQGVVLRGGPDTARPVAVLSSAAGIRPEDLAAESCPPPLAVTILHSAADERFPGYGAGVAAWWARCLKCEVPPRVAVPGTCAEAMRCAPNGMVRHCEGSETHSQRPRAFVDELLTSLERTRRPR
jgi:polyhydroxybutyrate depolymerase